MSGPDDGNKQSDEEVGGRMFGKKRDPHEDMKIRLTMILWGFLSFLSIAAVANAEKIVNFIISLFR